MKNKYTIDGEVAYIHIVRRNGYVGYAKVDKNDLVLLISHKTSWYINEYVKGVLRVQGRATINGAVVKTSLHRFILNFPDALVDHINNDALDNRRSNLRLADKVSNAQNYRSARSDNKVGILGVHYDKTRDKWVGQAFADGRSYRKRFNSVEEAEAFAKEMRRLHMPFSKEARED